MLQDVVYYKVLQNNGNSHCLQLSRRQLVSYSTNIYCVMNRIELHPVL